MTVIDGDNYADTCDDDDDDGDGVGGADDVNDYADTCDVGEDGDGVGGAVESEICCLWWWRWLC